MQEVRTIAQQAKQVTRQLAALDTATKNKILLAMAAALEQQASTIISANQQDLQRALAKGISGALLDRLTLNTARLADVVKGIQQIATLPDPIGALLSESQRPDGLIIRKVRVPIGVIGMIYEARPNVTADVAALCFKTGNAVILRGGSEALATNKAIIQAIQSVCQQTALPLHAIQLVEQTDHAAVEELVQLSEYIDLIIPRGGENLINTVCRHARVPVIKHYKGLCHTYVDASADQNMAINICENAKCQRPGVCNAMETLLVHQDAAPTFLPRLIAAMEQKHVECRGDDATRAIVPHIKPATDADWDTEYLDLILSIKVVPNLEAAITHINQHGSHHSDAIVTQDQTAAQTFLNAIDSAAVYVNASTRFTDGGEFGMGAEIGISTDKLHARGPMGLEELTTYKYVVMGQGHVRS